MSSKPKIILIGLIIIIIIFVALSFSSNDNTSDSGYEVEIFEVKFNIPEEFEESYHAGSFSSGETVDFQSADYDDLEISVSPYYNVDLNSNHVTAKYSKNIDGIDGTLVFYDSNRISFYYEYGDYLIKLNTNSPDYEDLFSFVII